MAPWATPYVGELAGYARAQNASGGVSSRPSTAERPQSAPRSRPNSGGSQLAGSGCGGSRPPTPRAPPAERVSAILPPGRDITPRAYGCTTPRGAVYMPRASTPRRSGSQPPRPETPRPESPGSSDAKELAEISGMLGRRVALRFKTINRCFMFLDADHSGGLTKDEMETLFRTFNMDVKMAHRFVDLIDTKKRGYIKYNAIRKIIAPHIQPGYDVEAETPRPRPPRGQVARLVSPMPNDPPENIPVQAESLSTPRTAVGALVNPLLEKPRERGSATPEGAPTLDEMERRRELRHLLPLVAEKLAAKFKSVRDAFRFADEDKSGQLKEAEMFTVFSNCGLPSHQARRLFKLIDTDGSGLVDFGKFSHLFGAPIQPGYALPDAERYDSKRPVAAADFNEPCSLDSARPEADARLESATATTLRQREAVQDAREIEKLRTLVGQKMRGRFQNCSSAFITMSTDKHGSVGRDELRHFVMTTLNMSCEVADQVFDHIDRRGSGEISVQQFTEFFGQEVRPGCGENIRPHSARSQRQNRPQSARAPRQNRPQSARSPRPPSCEPAKLSRQSSAASVSTSASIYMSASSLSGASETEPVRFLVRNRQLELDEEIEGLQGATITPRPPTRPRPPSAPPARARPQGCGRPQRR